MKTNLAAFGLAILLAFGSTAQAGPAKSGTCEAAAVADRKSVV